MPLWKVFICGAAPCFFRHLNVPVECRIHPLPQSISGVLEVSGERLKLLGVTGISIQNAPVDTEKLMISTKYLSVPIVLGASIINEYVESISPIPKMKRMTDVSRIVIVSQMYQSFPLRGAEDQVVPALTVAWLPIVSTYVGIGTTPPKNRNQKPLIANGMVNLPPTRRSQPSCTRFTNFSEEQIKIPRCLVVESI